MISPAEYGSTCTPLVGPTANEMVCSAGTALCDADEFRCPKSEFADAMCIPAEKVCDGQGYDRALNEDEEDCAF